MNLLLSFVAFAVPTHGERLRYEATWLGLLAGTAEAELHVADVEPAARPVPPPTWVATIKTRSSGMVESIYPVDDVVTGVWTSAGSVDYTTRFREGRFQQDQSMAFVGTSVKVSRRQLIDGVWKEWSDTYAVAAGLWDPVAAVYQLREKWTGTVELAAFSGKKTVPVRGTSLGVDPIDNVLGVATEKVDVRTGYDGTMKPWMMVWFGTDAARVPVEAVVQTRGGPVTIRLVERTLAPATAAEQK